MTSIIRKKSQRKKSQKSQRKKSQRKKSQRKKSQRKNDGTKEEDCDKKIKELSELGTQIKSSDRRTMLMKLAQHTNNVECIKRHISQFTRERFSEFKKEKLHQYQKNNHEFFIQDAEEFVRKKLNEYINKKDQFGNNALNLASFKNNLATTKDANLKLIEYLSKTIYDPEYLIKAIESDNDEISFYKEMINNEENIDILEITFYYLIEEIRIEREEETEIEIETETEMKRMELIETLKSKIIKELKKRINIDYITDEEIHSIGKKMDEIFMNFDEINGYYEKL
jgi:hypothetical protein